MDGGFLSSAALWILSGSREGGEKLDHRIEHFLAEDVCGQGRNRESEPAGDVYRAECADSFRGRGHEVARMLKVIRWSDSAALSGILPVPPRKAPRRPAVPREEARPESATASPARPGASCAACPATREYPF